MNKALFIYFFINFSLYAQNEISTRQYIVYKSNKTQQINFNEYLDNFNGDYLVKLFSITDLHFEKNKKVLIETCDLKFNISNSSNKINISRCNGDYSFDGDLIINDRNYVVNINTDKYKYLNCNFIFWISGLFVDDNLSINSNEEGIMREYYDSGNIYLEYNYSNGKKDGIQKRWYDNGQLEILYNYNMEKLEGLQKKWYENGRLKGEWTYYNDKLDGLVKEWYPNKQLKFVKEYKNGTLIKVIEHYDPEGNTIQ